MKQLMNLELFSLLSKNSEENNFFARLEKAYEEFSVKLLNKLQNETNITKLYYHLGFVRLELVGILDGLSDKQGKNALKITTKAISLIDIEQKRLQWQLQGSKIHPPTRTDNSVSNLIWTGTIADLVELAYGALETKKFNNGDIDENDLVERLCKLFSFEVKDCYDTFRAIRRRVDSRTLFLDEMKEKLNQRMDNMDNGIFKKKKSRGKSKE